jgi:hypothetical protein
MKEEREIVGEEEDQWEGAGSTRKENGYENVWVKCLKMYKNAYILQ